MINDDSEPHPVDYITGVKFTFLLFTTALVNAQMNGIITSVQSYAALPYSQATYHFAVTLSNVVSPLSSFLPFFISVRSIPVLAILTACSTAMTAFIVYLAALSPNLIFNSVTIGSALSIGGSLIAAGLHSYLRVVFASLLREGHQSESRLFWCGVFIQIGSFIGSAVMFPLVNIAHLFTSAPQCKSIS
ncbi:Riboflavin transporter [Caenorhabditis elegans]|nr:Riboflavin transporter [Caenorhabditis elegans]SAP35615.1 Riboflavin transporter [Caenorhabditis elegans]|eukprot:NP_001317853.1 Riboflavin transporter rft-2 [Caenorhabditis elegans]